jgi:hypothetical protein
MVRRLTGITTWVLLLRLNFVASDLVCARHHEMRDEVMPSMMQHHAPTNGTPNSGVTDGDNEACRVPARVDCCHAMASCAVTLGIGALPLALQPLTVCAAAATRGSGIPISFAVPPDPPPPKA